MLFLRRKLPKLNELIMSEIDKVVEIPYDRAEWSHSIVMYTPCTTEPNGSTRITIHKGSSYIQNTVCMLYTRKTYKYFRKMIKRTIRALDEGVNEDENN